MEMSALFVRQYILGNQTRLLYSLLTDQVPTFRTTARANIFQESLAREQFAVRGEGAIIAMEVQVVFSIDGKTRYEILALFALLRTFLLMYRWMIDERDDFLRLANLSIFG